MLYQNDRNGFTLIELLVVVLIIGILAAVALPQYQKAVKKARLAEYEVNLKSIAAAEEVCFLRKGSLCTLNELDIDAPTCKPIPGVMDECLYNIFRGGSYAADGSLNISDGLWGPETNVSLGNRRFAFYLSPTTVNSKTLQGLYCGIYYGQANSDTKCTELGFTSGTGVADATNLDSGGIVLYKRP